MKQCPKCKQIYSDEMQQCSECQTPLVNYVPESQKPEFKLIDIVIKYIKFVLPAILVIGFVLGFGFRSCTGIKKDEYNNLLAQIDTLTTDKESLISEKDSLSKEYADYKAKMQPYEEKQAADAKAEEERKAAEEKAKKVAEQKAAEEKAAKEAEEKKQQEAAAKADTLGLTIDDFYSSFNETASNNGFAAFLGKKSGSGSYIQYATLNSDIQVDCNLQNNYIYGVYVSAKRTTAESLEEATYYATTVTMVIDSSLSISEIDSLLASLVNGATDDYGNDYKITKNGIEYTANLADSDILFYFSKAR